MFEQPEKKSLGSRAIQGSLWTIAGYGVSQVIRLVSSLVVTRLLFPEAFALMAIVNAVLSGFAMFSDLGLSPNIVQSRRGDDPTFLKYRDLVAQNDPAATDVCALADQGLPFGPRSNVSDGDEMCNTADVAEVLQYVLLGTAVVSGGIGIYLLASAPDSEETLTVGAVRLTPRVGRKSAGLDARLNF